MTQATERFKLRDGGLPCEIHLDEIRLSVTSGTSGGKGNVAIPAAPEKPTLANSSAGQSVVLGRYDDAWGHVPRLAEEQLRRRELGNISYDDHQRWLSRTRAGGGPTNERDMTPPAPSCTTFDRDVTIVDPELTPARDIRVVASWFSLAISLGIGFFFFRRSRERRPRDLPRPRSPYR